MEQTNEPAWELAETETDEIQEQDSIAYQISYYPADITLKGYLDKWDAGQLEIPPFQRSYVWDQVRASKLIESFLIGLPVPGVFLYKERATNKLQVIDGQQRILTAIRYFKNEFGESIFRLKRVQNKWEGMTYTDLSESDRFQLDDAVLRATVVQQLDPADDSSIYYIFERLNTGGVNLNPMEIRKCVYFGPTFTLLEELNNDKNWRELIGKEAPDKRLRDVEMVLRVIALSASWETYEKPMKGFLNSFLASNRRSSDEEKKEFIEFWRHRFIAGCQQVRSSIGAKPFHLRGRLNYAVMDSTLAMAILACDEPKDDFAARFKALLADKAFIASSTISTSDERTLTERFSIARRFLLS